MRTIFAKHLVLVSLSLTLRIFCVIFPKQSFAFVKSLSRFLNGGICLNFLFLRFFIVFIIFQLFEVDKGEPRKYGEFICGMFESVNPANIYLLKVNNRNTRERCEIYSKLTIKIVERRWVT